MLFRSGMPDYFLTAHYPTGLEDDFTVVWWEQRGFGISFDPESDPGCLNTEQMLSDIKSLTDSLRTRFGQEKIYLMGRSGGTYTGIQAAARYPECFHAYIGIGQMTDQLESEKQAYTFMLQRYREAGNIRWVKRLEAVPVVETIPAAYLKLRDPAMHSLGIGTTRTMRSVARELFLPSLTFREYTLREKIRFWRAKARYGVHPLWEEILRTSMIQKVNHLEIPVYFLHGRYDYTVSYSLAREYYEALEAPVKAFFTFENSAHSPHMEEPQKTREILRTHILKQNPAGLQ